MVRHPASTRTSKTLIYASSFYKREDVGHFVILSEALSLNFSCLDDSDLPMPLKCPAHFLESDVLKAPKTPELQLRPRFQPLLCLSPGEPVLTSVCVLLIPELCSWCQESGWSWDGSPTSQRPILAWVAQGSMVGRSTLPKALLLPTRCVSVCLGAAHPWGNSFLPTSFVPRPVH